MSQFAYRESCVLRRNRDINYIPKDKYFVVLFLEWPCALRVKCRVSSQKFPSGLQALHMHW